ncbi:hypothetical protein Tco_0987972 [Tanacetum coccineum]|uniref:Uncharacterized protein n=1 Tax=Tanacetum coccineum TaxID=301880 RepID=A0ABQ5EPP4_9ASTR
MEYAPTTYQHQQSEFSQPDSGLIVLVFQKGDDPIDVINHMMSFLTAVVTSRYPTTNNHFSEFKQTNQYAKALSSILGIVDQYLANKMKEAVDVAVQLKSDRIREEAQAENQ